ncbi:MAG: prepilin-type N-terminal cleavage/methylation domain-containing protein [Desulfobulbus sp.]|nr:prepilin-type N-terminal cleavage/methylation domain-containing protein [Desulfobulbus sp.]
MKGQGGFTLVELVVVIAIIVTLLAVATLYFLQFNERYQVDSLTKEIYSALMRARNAAVTSGVPHIADFAAGDPFHLQVGPDADGDGVIDSPPRLVGTVVSDIQSPGFRIVLNNAPIVFDRRGLANQDQTLTIGVGNLKFGATPGCIAIASTRINVGKMEGANCVQR